MGKIYFMTIAYNAEKTLTRCVESVFNQTKYSENIEYWFCENGSTDRTREMIEEYAQKDSRIKLFYNDVNYEWNPQSFFILSLPHLLKEGDYLCWLDSDDEYKLDFLEKTIPFILENDLDLAFVGSDFIDAASEKIMGHRSLERPLVLDKPNLLANYFPVYHQFARTMWGKIFTGKIANQMLIGNDRTPEWWSDFGTALDTVMVFSVLKHCKRVGIYPGTFHKYYMSNKSTSHVWNNKSFNGNMMLNEDAEDYLKRFGPISERNRGFLDRVYANAVSDSIVVLCNAQGMTAEEKLKELRKAVDYRITHDIMVRGNDDAVRCKRNIFNAALRFGFELKQENEALGTVLMLICPNCAPFVEVNELELYAREGALQNALFNDDMAELVDQLLRLISKGAYTKQFDLFKIVEKFSANRGLVSKITDVHFIKKYSDIFLLIWQKKYIQAIDKMTDLLLNVKSLDETFLMVYLDLAALLESADEFVFGKVKLAAYYCGHGRSEECLAVLNDLADMGVEDNDEITEIKAKLKNR